MKSKLTKIMGVTLALVLVFALGAAFLPANTPLGPKPAEAATLAWSGITVPSGVGNVLVGQDENLGPVAISPNFATDNTVFAVINDGFTTAAPLVYKSTNGGHTWVATTSTLGAAGDMGIALAVSPNFAFDNTVFVVTQTPGGGATTGLVYRSVNGGATYGQLGVVTLLADEVITSFDVAPDYDGTGVLVVGIADIVDTVVPATALGNVQVWGLGSVLSWTLYGSAVLTDISAVKFSPNYAIDSTILVVSSAANTEPLLRSIVGGTWDTIAATSIGATAVDDVDQTGNVADSLYLASIALPSDYNGTIATLRRAYVSIVGAAGAGALTGNVYRITNVTAGTAIATAATLLLSNIEYRGTFSSGTLIGGLWAAGGSTKGDVFRTTNPTSSVVDWYAVAGPANKPSGTTEATMTNNTTAFIAMSAEFVTDSTVVVGTVGDDSAFGVSTDGAVSFNETGLIDNSNAGGADTEGTLGIITDAELSPNFATDNTLFLVTENDNGINNNANAWFSNNGGVLWTRAFTATFAAPGRGIIAYTPDFTVGSTAGKVYVAETGNGALDLWISNNGGQSWSARTAANITGIQTLAAIDSIIYAGDSATGRVAKSTNEGWTWPAPLTINSSAANRVASLKVQESTLIVGGGGGTVRKSIDGGSTWSLVGGGALANANVYADFDAPGTTVYATENGTGNVFRSVDGAAWIEIGANSSGANATALTLASDGTLYYLEVAGQDVQRSINPTAAVPTPNVTFQGMTLLPTATAIGAELSVAGGSSNTVLVLTALPGPTLRIYTDTLTAGSAAVNLVSPDNDSTLMTGTDAVFTIEGVTSATAYTVWWSTTSGFSSDVNPVNWNAINGVKTPSQDLSAAEGQIVYWMSRVTAPFNGPWSEVWSFQTQVVSVVVAPTPAYPAGDDVMDISVTPIINWSAFKYANGYELQLAADADMTDLVVDATGADALGNITSYKISDPLAYDTTYYWHVRAILGSAAAYSDWSAVVGFTTKAVPVEPEPTTIIVEPTPVTITPAPAPAPEPTTPAYIWGIIAIGAVLVIVVIVLILRTRRTV